jgi:pilus assembly protein CpaF
MSTLHAHTAMDALNRLETLAMMSKIELPLHALRAQIASAIDLVVQMTRFPDGRREITQITEVMPLTDEGHYRAQEMFVYAIGEEGRGGLQWTGVKSLFRNEPRLRILADQWNLTKKLFEADIP